MNKIFIIALQNYVEENSQYCKLLKERFIDEQEYTQKLTAIQQGLNCLRLSTDVIKIFENKQSFNIRLGGQVTKYEGYELPLYIGHKKMGLPIPQTLIDKCPREIITFIDQVRGLKYLYEFNKELQSSSFSPDIFLNIHKCIMTARVENLLPGLLSDIERFGFMNFIDAIKKISLVYLNYLSPASIIKLIKKISFLLQKEKDRLNEEIKNVDLHSLRLKEQMETLYQETTAGLKNIVENEIKKGADIETITQKVANQISRLERLYLGNIYHLEDYEKKRQSIRKFFAEEEELKYLAEKRVFDKTKKIVEIFEEYLFFCKFGSLTPQEDKFFTKSLIEEFEELHRQKSKDLPLLNKFERRGLLGVELDFEVIMEAYHSFMKNIIISYCIGQYLLDIVNCLPPRPNEPQKLVTDIANFSILALKGRGLMELKNFDQEYQKGMTKFIEAYRKCITVLVYDIRGSSYMGMKLHNALKEQRIKYKFAREMAEIVNKYDGFLLKDTGDGGIVWFSDNSGSLYHHLYAESTTGRGTNLRYSIFSGAEFELIPAADAAKRAILCARDMILKAEEFIRANFMHYREWFAEVTERTLEVEGVTYALLPPQFKSLFRIGVGIASGTPNKDVVFAANSFGDPDLVGPILADANLYSMERQPGRSVVICDLPTFINFILNVENFEYPIQEKDFEKYLQAVEELKKAQHAYTLSDLKISIVPRGIHILEELNKSKALAEAKISEVVIDDDNNTYNEEKKKIKLIFEILNI